MKKKSSNLAEENKSVLELSEGDRNPHMARNCKSSSDDREKLARDYSPTKSITNPLVILPGGVAICVEPTVIPIAVESAVKSNPGTGENSSSSESKSSSNKRSQQQHEERTAIDKITPKEVSNP